MSKENISISKGPKATLVLKILIDVTMFVLYFLLVFGLGTSLFFHETAGLLIGGLYHSFIPK